MEGETVMDISKLSEKELIKLRGEIDKAISGLAKKKLDSARKAAEAAAKKHGYSLKDLVGGTKPVRKKAVTAPRYRNPANEAETWSGRGRQPGWFKEAVAAGADPSSMEI